MLVGLVLGLAIYNAVLLDFPLPLVLYSKLIGQAVGLRDLEDMDPVLGKSLKQLLQYEGERLGLQVAGASQTCESDAGGKLRPAWLGLGS